MKNITQIVANELANASELCLNDIVDHGIHNLTNDFHGDNDEEYESFQNEFARQAVEKIPLKHGYEK